MKLKKLIATVGLLVGICFSAQAAETVKNVIWIIGDGMGPEIMGFFMEGARYGNLQGYGNKVSNMEKLLRDGTQGLYFNNTYNTIVTDSAASANQMATGVLSIPETIGLDYKGEPAQTIMELAQKKGKSIGIISDAYVTDATPAGFTAHTAKRGNRHDIARQQIKLGVDVISGGGLKYFNTDENENLLKEAEAQGYHIALNRKELDKVTSGKLLGLFSDAGMPPAIEMYQHPQVPSLWDQTKKALALLEQNKNGFVLMVEAGKIDWSAHANDAGGVLAEMKVIDSVIYLAREYAEKHPGTLVYVNADHDTGLGTFVYHHLDSNQAAHKSEQGEMLYGGNTYYADFRTYKLLEKQKRSLYAIAQDLHATPWERRTPDYVQRRLSEGLGYVVDISQFDNIRDVNGLFRQLNRLYGLSWATGNHSAAPLISIAYGPQAELFGGVYHNTDIFPRLKEAFGWTEEKK